MFSVYYFNHSNEDFEVIGTFSKREDAESLLAERAAGAPPQGAVLEESFDVMVARATNARLGALASALALSGVKTPWPTELWIVWNSDGPIAAFREDKSARAFQALSDGRLARTVEFNPSAIGSP